MTPTVLLYHCQDYQPERIAEIVCQGMDTLGVRPRGRTMIKPNVVLAHPKHFRHAFTRPEFLDGLLAALRAHGGEISDLSVGERSGITVPTRYTFAQAGYGPVLRRRRARPVYFDETPQVAMPLRQPQALRPSVVIAEPVTRCDFLVNAPKLKSHPWTKFTAALKNYIGLQDDDHRLLDHERLPHKIADLQEVISPGLIAVDAIVIGQGSMMTPSPRHLGLIILGVNPVAVDAVCAHILGLDPAKVDYLRLCAERGLGPLDMDDIDIRGNVTLAEAQRRAIGVRLALDPVDKQFGAGSRIRAFSGPPGDPAIGDYCWGGCPGTLYEAAEIIRQFQPDVYERIRPVRFVFGCFRGALPADAGSALVFVGDCAQFSGQANGAAIDIPSVFSRARARRPRPDVFRNTLRVLRALWRGRGRRAVVLRGCPVSVSETVLALVFLGRVANPYLSPDIVPGFMYHYLVAGVRRFLRAGRVAR